MHNFAENHLFGHSELAILRFDETVGDEYMMLTFGLFNVVLLLLTVIFYRKGDSHAESAHNPHLEETEKFTEAILSTILPETYR